MRRLKTLTVGLVCGLVVTLAINVVVLIENLELRRSFDELYGSYDELYQTYLSIYPRRYHPPSKPPISKLEAISIALEYGGWNETTLKGYVVTATLCYVKFSKDDGFVFLHEVTEPVSDYGETHVGDTTYRYVWYITVNEAGQGSIPPPGTYLVDVATGEVIPLDLL